MPVYRVKKGNKTGYRYGKTGKIYYGRDARERAARQGSAIRASGYKGS